MRISYFYDLPLPSRFAAPIQILNTARHLAELGVPTTVYAGPVADGALAHYGLAPHANLGIVPFFSPAGWRMTQPRRLRRMLEQAERRGGTHFVVSRGETGVELLPRLRQIRRSPATRLVYEAHRLGFAHEAERRSGRRWQAGAPLPLRAERIRRRERAAVEGADALVCLTAGVRHALEASFKVACPVLVLPSGTATDSGPGAAARRDIDVIYAGKLETRKGLDLLLEAMRGLPGRNLWILGGEATEIDRYRGLARNLGIDDRVVFAGFVEPARVPGYLRRARVGVCALPSGVSVVSEEFTSPLKLLELMAHRVPVVATDLPSVRAIAEHGSTALLVPADDAAALAAGIETILRCPQLAERLRAAAARRAVTFSWPERARQLQQFFRTMAAEVCERPAGGDARRDAALVAF